MYPITHVTPKGLFINYVTHGGVVVLCCVTLVHKASAGVSALQRGGGVRGSENLQIYEQPLILNVTVSLRICLKIHTGTLFEENYILCIYLNL